VQDSVSHGQRAQTQSRVARKAIPLAERAAYSPAEFAALCGKSPTGAYRLIYAGKLKPITEFGRILIPHAQLDAVLARCAECNPVVAQ
jgi:Helix-turn-helix domain